MAELSLYKHEKEILITSNCTYRITNKNMKNVKNKDTENDNDSLEEISLTCEGYKIDNSNNNKIINFN